jgi:hypothetical protein
VQDDLRTLVLHSKVQHSIDDRCVGPTRFLSTLMLRLCRSVRARDTNLLASIKNFVENTVKVSEVRRI